MKMSAVARRLKLFWEIKKTEEKIKTNTFQVDCNRFVVLDF